MNRRFRLFFAPLAALLGLAAACAPIIEPAGPPIGPPSMNGEALVMADGDTLALQSWLPEGEPDAVILALHGFNDYANAFDAPAQAWAKHGIATFAYDQRGFGHDDHAGLWAGEETLVADAIAGVDLIRARYPDKPVFLMGESMGGAVAILAAAHNPPVAVDGLILVAPAVWARETMPVSYRVSLWLGARLAPSMTLRGSNLDIWPSDNIEMLRALGADPLVIKETRVDAVYGLVNVMDAALAAAPNVHVPTLLLYGANDQIVPAEPVGMFVADLAPRHRVAVYDAGYHMLLRDLEAEVVVDDIATWIGEPDGALPSGAEASAAAFFAAPPDEPTPTRPETLYATQRRPS
jgi:alpha-beta hydrolase superfamily lysophospholipase